MSSSGGQPEHYIQFCRNIIEKLAPVHPMQLFFAEVIAHMHWSVQKYPELIALCKIHEPNNTKAIKTFESLLKSESRELKKEEARYWREYEYWLKQYDEEKAKWVLSNDTEKLAKDAEMRYMSLVILDEKYRKKGFRWIRSN